MNESVSLSVSIPADGAQAVRRSLGLSDDEELRIAFVAGPGDAVGTFDRWVLDEHDLRNPVIAYSTMFYSLVESLKAKAMILVEQTTQPRSPRAGFSFVNTPRRRDRSGFLYHLDQWKFYRVLEQHVKRFRPHILIVGTDSPGQLAVKASAYSRIILTAHNTYWPMGQKPSGMKATLKLSSVRRSLRHVSAAVSTSQECARQVAELGGPSVNSFVETPQILRHFFSEGPSGGKVRRLLFLGRIEENKGVFDLLAAFEAVARDHGDLRLDYAGIGSKADLLKEAIARSDYRDRITYHGLLDARAVHAILSEADLLICPTRSSFTEGLALVVIEAAVHGIPTLLSSIVPAKDILRGACFEFPVDDLAGLIAKLREVAESPEEVQRVRTALNERKAIFADRSLSWGSMLYKAMASRPSADP